MTARGVFLKSTYSGYGNCVEVADDGDVVLVRDSKHPDGGTLRISAAAWAVFIADVKSGRFDN